MRLPFAALFARYERRIYAFVYRMMGNPDDAFDLTQETFLKAYRALEKTDEELNVNAWLHRIASMASGGMDTLPHNGAVITLLAITGLTHRQSYPDIFAITLLKTSTVFALAAAATAWA